MSWLDKLGLKKKEKLEKGVEKSREGLLNKISKSLAGKDKVDDAIKKKQNNGRVYLLIVLYMQINNWKNNKHTR